MDPIQDIPPASNSIWPFETGKAPDTSLPRQFDRMRCFILCPFTRAEITTFLVKQAANYLKIPLKHDIDVYFAGDISGSRAIHPDIWTHIKQADIIIADLTGYNTNVVFELGVAAAWRLIDSVIILRDESDQQTIAFDLHPVRQILYDSRKIGWIGEVINNLEINMWLCLSQVPFRDEPKKVTKLPLNSKLSDGRDNTYLWSPGPTHRRLTQEGLEFGSPFYFPYSWLSPAGLRISNVSVQAEMSFSDIIDPESWIGIALRSQGYMANNEHLVWLKPSGIVMRTGPSVDGTGADEHEVGKLTSLDSTIKKFIPFDIFMNDKVWFIGVGEVRKEIPITDLIHHFGQGRILFQTYHCRAIVKNVKIRSKGK